MRISLILFFSLSTLLSSKAADGLLYIVAAVQDSDCKNNGLHTGQIDLTVTGGNPGYTYSWEVIAGDDCNISVTHEDQTGLSQGTYRVTVLDSDGCSAVEQYNVSELNSNECTDPCSLPDADCDNDGMPKVWEQRHGLNDCDPTDAFCDNDDDKVINLFEFQLDTDPNDAALPIAHEVDSTMSRIDLERLLSSNQGRPIVIRMSAGTFDERTYYNPDFGTTFPLDPTSRMRVMLQGGWNSDHTDQDAFIYRTKITSDLQFFRFDLEQVLAQDRSATILEGLELIETKVFIDDTKEASHYSMYNCSLTGNNGFRELWIHNQDFGGYYDVNLINTSIHSTQSGIYNLGFRDTEENLRLRLLHVNFTTTMNTYAFVDDSCKIDLINSNVWDEGNHVSISGATIINPPVHAPIDICANTSNLSSIMRNGHPGKDTFINTTDLNPLYLQENPPHYILSPGSPLKAAGLNMGLPHHGPKPDIGVNQFAYSRIRLIEKIIATNPSCGISNGSITLEMQPTYKELEFSLDNFVNSTESQPHFDNLSAGDYVIYIRTIDNCAHFQQRVTLYNIEDMFLNLPIIQTRATCGENNGILELDIPDDWTDYSYSLDSLDFVSEPIFENLAANFYFIYVKFSDDCVKKVFAILNSESDIDLEISSIGNTTCGKSNGTLDLSLSGEDGGYQLDWSDGRSGSKLSFDNLSAGHYSITITDDKACKDSIEVEILSSTGIAFEDPVLAHTTCGLENGSIELSTNMQGGVFSLLLNGQDGQLDNQDLSPGSYDFHITDSDNCSDEISVLIQASEPIDLIQVEEIPTTCNQDNGAVKVIELTGDPTEYSYDGLLFVPTNNFTGLAPDSYFLYAKNEHCIDSIEFTIAESTLPELQIVAFDDTSCGEKNGSVLLNTLNGTGPFSYAIDTVKNGTGEFDTLSAGSYIAYVEDFSACVDSVNLDIATSEGVILSATAEDGFCGNLGTIHLSAIGGAGGYEFSEANASFSKVSELRGLEVGTYIFYLRDSEGCFDTVQVSVEVYEVPTLSAEFTPAYCGNLVGTATLIGHGGKGTLNFAIKETLLSADTFFDALPGGPISFIVSDQTGCSSEKTFDIPSTPPVRIEDLSVEQLICGAEFSEVIFTTAGGTGTLSYRVLELDTEAVINLNEGLQEGSYKLIVTDELGCEKSETILISKEDCTIYIPTAFNPSLLDENRKFRIGVPTASNLHISSFQIYDRWGELIYNKRDLDPLLFTDWWDGTYNGNELASGVYAYFIQLANGDSEQIYGTITLIR